jgi:ATP-binding cassette subfamily B protein/subfamily B ATP-binding cassette protein MsbA
MARVRIRNSRKAFREFLRERGLLGRKETEEEKEEKEKQQKDGQDDRAAAAESAADAGEAGEAKKPKRSYIRRYIQELGRQRGKVALILFLMLLGVVLRAALPWSGKFMIDYILPLRDPTVLLATAGLLLVIGLLGVLVSLLSDFLTRSLLGSFVVHIKRRLMKHLQRLPLQRLQQLKVGGIVSRLQGDTEGMAGLLHAGLLTPLTAAVRFAFALGSLLLINTSVALLCVGLSGLLLGCSYVYFNYMRPYWKALREEIAKVGGNLTEVFSGLPVVRAFGRERSEARGYALDIHLLWRKSLHGEVLTMGLHRSIWMVYWLLNVAIWAYGGYQYIEGRMSTGDLVAFIAFVEWFFGPIFMIMGSLAQLQNTLACSERVFDLLDEPAGMADPEDAEEIERLREGLRLEQVSFDYPDGTRALTDVDLAIPTGKVTALVGPSGAGKTTITNLVMRFYDVTEGRILADGTDIRKLKLSSYRRLLSLVLQDVFLFDGTVRENIAYGHPEATQEDLEAAAKVAHCHEFVSEFDDGYDTVIGERGVKLSGGQKQRIALARAVLTDPQILILDEATSNLDSESERLIQAALREIFEQRTTIVIAHRLSTVLDADKLVVLDKGRVVEEGTHEELLARQGRYWELYTHQMEKAEKARGIFDWSTGEEEEPDGEGDRKGPDAAAGGSRDDEGDAA